MPFPSLSCPEGPVNQVDTPSRFLSSPPYQPQDSWAPGRITHFLTSLAGPRHPASQVVVMTPSQNRER